MLIATAISPQQNAIALTQNTFSLSENLPYPNPSCRSLYIKHTALLLAHTGRTALCPQPLFSISLTYTFSFSLLDYLVLSCSHYLSLCPLQSLLNFAVCNLVWKHTQCTCTRTHTSADAHAHTL